MLSHEGKKILIKTALFREMGSAARGLSRIISGSELIPEAIKTVARYAGRTGVKAAKNVGKHVIREGKYLRIHGDVSPVSTAIILSPAIAAAARSYTVPGGTLYNARMRYLRSMYTPGGALNRINRGVNYISDIVSGGARQNYNRYRF